VDKYSRFRVVRLRVEFVERTEGPDEHGARPVGPTVALQLSPYSEVGDIEQQCHAEKAEAHSTCK
jgi:hypothetical protein